MPNVSVYVSESDWTTIAKAEVSDDTGESLSIGLIASRMLHWFAKDPDAPLRRSTVMGR